MPMKIMIDWDLCESNFICNDFSPEVFTIDEENDELIVIEERVDRVEQETIYQAEARCPKGAISIKTT